MPHISIDKVKVIRETLKKKFPDVKFSVKREHHSSVVIAIMSSPFSWEKGYIQINHFFPENYENSEFLTEVIKIANSDNSVQTVDGDYGAIPRYYVDVTVGKYDKHHITTSNKVKTLAFDYKVDVSVKNTVVGESMIYVNGGLLSKSKPLPKK